MLLGEVVSTKTIAYHHRGCGWLASRRGSKYKKKHIVTKDVVGLLVGEVVSTKKVAHRRRGCGWLASRRGSKYKKNTSSQRMWLAYK